QITGRLYNIAKVVERQFIAKPRRSALPRSGVFQSPILRRTPQDQSTDNPREITPYRQSTQGTSDCRLSAMQGQQPEEGSGSRWEGLRKTVGGYVYGDGDQSGSRRQRLAGYMKAANELRQS